MPLEISCLVVLPPTDIENQPAITPLAILNTRWDHSVTEPRLSVLVQWAGLSPNDTSWEDWDNLKATYHLEDKMFLDGLGDDRKRTMAQQSTTDTCERPKRKIICQNI